MFLVFKSFFTPVCVTSRRGEATSVRLTADFNRVLVTHESCAELASQPITTVHHFEFMTPLSDVSSTFEEVEMESVHQHLLGVRPLRNADVTCDVSAVVVGLARDSLFIWLEIQQCELCM